MTDSSTAIVPLQVEAITYRFRAQVHGVNGWVDGGLFTRRKGAEKDAARLADLFDRPVRVLEFERATPAGTTSELEVQR